MHGPKNQIAHERILGELSHTVASLTLGNRIAQYLLDRLRENVRVIPTDVVLNAPGHRVHIQGTSCGFFTTPAIQIALLEVRRTLAFFRLRFDTLTLELKTFTQNKFPDDVYVTDLGLPSLDPDLLFELALKHLGKPPIESLREVLAYSDKELAHLTTTISLPDMSSVIDSTALMKQALMIFVFDALNIARPSDQLTISSEP